MTEENTPTRKQENPLEKIERQETLRGIKAKIFSDRVLSFLRYYERNPERVEFNADYIKEFAVQFRRETKDTELYDPRQMFELAGRFYHVLEPLQNGFAQRFYDKFKSRIQEFEKQLEAGARK